MKRALAVAGVAVLGIALFAAVILLGRPWESDTTVPNTSAQQTLQPVPTATANMTTYYLFAKTSSDQPLTIQYSVNAGPMQSVTASGSWEQEITIPSSASVAEFVDLNGTGKAECWITQSLGGGNIARDSTTHPGGAASCLL